MQESHTKNKFIFKQKPKSKMLLTNLDQARWDLLVCTVLNCVLLFLILCPLHCTAHCASQYNTAQSNEITNQRLHNNFKAETPFKAASKMNKPKRTGLRGEPQVLAVCNWVDPVNPFQPGETPDIEHNINHRASTSYMISKWVDL